MKELDILLERFVDHQQQSLSEGAWPEFESLLETEDDILWDWVQDSAQADASKYRDLLQRIRHGAK